MLKPAPSRRHDAVGYTTMVLCVPVPVSVPVCSCPLMFNLQQPSVFDSSVTAPEREVSTVGCPLWNGSLVLLRNYWSSTTVVLDHCRPIY